MVLKIRLADLPPPYGERGITAMCNGFGNNCTWIILLLIILCCCGGNDCGNNNGCGCGC